MTETAVPLQTPVTTELENPQPRSSPFANRNFRLLWIGESVSLFGDQFYMVALPWLVLTLTGSEAALGAIFMAAGIPRAIFMLIGGVLTDRFAPRTMMLFSNVARLIITIVLCAIVLTNVTQVWMLFVIAILFGFTDAFFHPAYMAMAPQIVDDDALTPANSALQGTALLMNTAGPGIAGIFVKAAGVGMSFVLDAVTFIVASLTLIFMRPEKMKAVPRQQQGSMIKALGEMIRFVADDPVLRIIMIVSLALNLLAVGTFMVGIPALAKERFAEGALALGVLLSASSLGSLLGIILSNIARPKNPGLVIMFVLAFGGLTIALMGFTDSLIVAGLLTLITGITMGFTNIIVITWMQKRIAKEMMGRVMSLLMLGSTGAIPISAAVAGIIAENNLTLLFVGSGLGLSLISLLSVLNKHVRAIGAEIE